MRLAACGPDAVSRLGKRLQQLETREIEQLGIGELRCGYIADAGEYRLDTAGKLEFPLLEHISHDQALHMRLRAAQGAGNDREFARGGIALDAALRRVGQRTNHDVAPIVSEQR